MDREIGSLEKGKKADFILVQTNSAHAQPLYNIYSQIVYDLKGADVRTSVIGGKMVMFEGRVLTLDEQQILQQTKRYQSAISSRPK